MQFNRDVHHRKSIRLNGYDYSQKGAYFITFCTQNREHLFGEVIDSKMELNDAGAMVQTIWDELPTRFDNIIMDESIIMPDHSHGIIIITPDTQISRTGDPFVRPQTTQYIPPHPLYTSPNSNNLNTTKKCRDHNCINKNYYDENHKNIIHTLGDHNCINKNYYDENHKNIIHTLGDHKDRPYGTLPGSLGRIIQAFKSLTTHEYTINVKQHGWTPFPGKLWQRNYWEYIIRNGQELNRIRMYIQNNPAKW